MSGAPIVVTCYRNGVDSYGTWLTDRTMLDRIRALAREGGKNLVADVIWHGRELPRGHNGVFGIRAQRHAPRHALAHAHIMRPSAQGLHHAHALHAQRGR
jgi:hypothetical protein